MSIQESTPGVYINEITGPGVIQGVGTSTAAFLGPTPAGPSVPRRVTTYDEFVTLYGGTGPTRPHVVADGHLFHLALAVQGFFQNGGTAAYVVRIDNSTLGSLDLLNGDGATVATVRAQRPDATPSVTVDPDPDLDVVFAQSTIEDPGGESSPIEGDDANDRLLGDASDFRVGDRVSTDGAAVAQLTHVDGNWVRPSVALADAANLQTAPLDPAQSDASFRVDGPAGVFRAGSVVELESDAGTERLVVLSVAGDRMTTTPVSAAVDLDGTNAHVTPAQYTLASHSTAVTGTDGTELTVTDASGFASGDVVTAGGPTATVVTVVADKVTLDTAITGPTLAIADLTPERGRARLADARGLRPGTLLRLDDGTDVAHGIVSSVSTSGVVTFAGTIARTVTIDAGASATPVEFALVVTEGSRVEAFAGLSMNPTSAGYLFTSVSSAVVTVEPPATPVAASLDRLTPGAVDDQALSAGVVGSPTGLNVAEYQAGLDALTRVDDVNLVCAPDVASIASDDVRRTIQGAMVTHCLDQADRIAVLDPQPDLPPSGPGSIEEAREYVQSERGFAALYYPWLVVLDPTQVAPAPPRRITIPPSGHVAGVMARVDAERGVFKAPANVPVRGVLGVERQVTDREQAPLNRGGTNVLRVLPGSTAVMVWGARTTVDPNVTDWIYVNVRRLLLFIEESIQDGIRWAVFEPNDLGLWKSLDRVIRAFLRQQWRAGALFGATEDQAFSVRIDEGLNPPEVRNIGRLNIEIRVAPVRPAEFIVITIGLFDGGADVDEA